MSLLEFFLHLVCSVLILSSMAAFSFDQQWIGIGIVITVVVIEITIFKVNCWHRCKNGSVHSLPRDPEQAITVNVLATDERSRLIHPPDSADGLEIPGKTKVSYGISGQTWLTPRGSYFPVFQSFGSVCEINETAPITSDLRLSCDGYSESHMFSFDSQYDSVEEQFMQSIESDENSNCVSEDDENQSILRV